MCNAGIPGAPGVWRIARSLSLLKNTTVVVRPNRPTTKVALSVDRGGEAPENAIGNVCGHGH
jgi:hypothetical protein